MSPVQMGMQNFDELVSGPKPLLIDFYADWCGPCQMLSPIIDEIANEREDITVCRVNIDDEPELANRFAVSAVPTLVVMKDGRKFNSGLGYMPKAQVLALLP